MMEAQLTNTASDKWKYIGFNDTWFSFSFTAMYWLGLRYLMQMLRKRYDGFEHTMKRLVIIALVILFIGPLAGGILNFILDNLADLVNYERMYQGSFL